MNKVLFLGNSHIGALKLGFSSSSHGFNAGFIAVPDQGFNKGLRLDANVLKLPRIYERFCSGIDLFCNNSEKACRVELDSFDYFVYVNGLSRLDPRLYYVFCKTKKLLNTPKLSKELLLKVVFNGNLASEKEGSGRTLSALYSELLKYFGDKVFFLGAPLQSSEVLNQFTIESIDNVVCNSLVIRSIANESIHVDSMPNILLPPVCLCDKSSIYTKMEFFKNSVNWNAQIKDSGIQKRDISHVGGNYGDILISEVLRPIFSSA
jgi:hypothetical protein